MSLDVYLVGDEYDTEHETDCRHCGEPMKHPAKARKHFYSANITHNLGLMAVKAGIYGALWRGGCDPDSDVNRLTGKRARDIIPVLREGLAKLKADPGYYKQFNAENGWGLYEHFVPFVEKYLAACEENPEAWIEISR